ncbi:IS5 family transposase [Pararhizobium sp. LjRoot255]|uniref:IS5 family transposase n=1 Tax=Pararhizobium sp. LjRoot255 TaxID=3342298 RepID=UPI003ECC76C9
MSDLFLLSERQMARISPHFPLSHGVARVDDQRVVSGIVYVIRNGLQWKDAPSQYGPHKTLYNRCIRWSRLGVFDRIFASLAGEGPQPERIMIDATHLKADRTAASLLKKGMFPRRIGRTKGGLNSKLHAVCDDDGRPIIMLLSEGQMSDHKGARIVLNALPKADCLIADKGYDSTWFREELLARGIEPCIPSSKSRKKPYVYDKALYRRRHKVENLFAKLKVWRRIATRYDRCAHTFFSAICIAASVIFWL